MHKLESLSQPEFVEEDAQVLAQELHESFGNNKKFLPEFELPALVALSFYPELTDVKIEFVPSSGKEPFNSHPRYATMFKHPKERTYVVCISNRDVKGRENIAPRNLTFNAKVGMIARELAHICEYLHKTSFQALAAALRYRSRRARRKAKRKIDLLTVAHGMGNQLKEFRNIIRRMKEQSPKDKYFRKLFEDHLEPGEIDRIIILRQRVQPENSFDRPGSKR